MTQELKQVSENNNIRKLREYLETLFCNEEPDESYEPDEDQYCKLQYTEQETLESALLAFGLGDKVPSHIKKYGACNTVYCMPELGRTLIKITSDLKKRQVIKKNKLKYTRFMYSLFAEANNPKADYFRKLFGTPGNARIPLYFK